MSRVYGIKRPATIIKTDNTLTIEKLSSICDCIQANHLFNAPFAYRIFLNGEYIGVNDAGLDILLSRLYIDDSAIYYNNQLLDLELKLFDRTVCYYLKTKIGNNINDCIKTHNECVGLRGKSAITVIDDCIGAKLTTETCPTCVGVGRSMKLAINGRVIEKCSDCNGTGVVVKMEGC